MSSEIETIKVAVALASNVLNIRAELSRAVAEVNRKASTENRKAQVEVVSWYEEGTHPGFYRESPRVLIDRIREAHSPDIIIAVFWGRFGTEVLDDRPAPEQEFSRFAEVLRQPGFPRVRVYFLEKDFYPQKGSEEEAQYKYFSEFRAYFRSSQGKLWWWVKTTKLRPLILDKLWESINLRTTGGGPNWIEKTPLKLKLPDGWQHIDSAFLNEQRKSLGGSTSLSAEDAASFFDGEYPKWWHIVSDSVPPREVVQKLEDKIIRNVASKRTRVTLLIGPGGEGKSTILQQVAANLAENHQDIRVIWRDLEADQPARLEKSWLEPLLESEEHVVIVCDNAAQIVEDIWHCARSLSNPPSNIQFLLASSSLEWEWKKADLKDWSRTLGSGNFRKELIRALTEEDADRIVKSWKAAGPSGLGDFIKVEEGRRAATLYRLAKEEERKNPKEGSFLGAMLEARKSDTFNEYVGNILGRLESRPALGGRTLRDVFAYIAALHADGKHILTRPILSYLLKCSPAELQRQVIEPLVEEADVSAGLLVLTRHRTIARVARQLLAEKPYRVNFEHEILPQLVRAPIEKYHADKKNRSADERIEKEELSEWNRLPYFYAAEENFIDFYQSRKNQTDLALRLAQSLADAEPDDPMPVNNWAHIYRNNKQLKEAANVFRRRYHLISSKKLNKGFFTEWAAAESRVKNHCCDAWLCGIALSDMLADKHPGDSAPMIILSSLTSAFEPLYKKASDPHDTFNELSNYQTFLKAYVAAGRLGLDPRSQIDLRPGYNKRQSEEHLLRAKALGVAKNISNTSPAEAIDWITSGISLAWQLREKDEYLDDFPFDFVPGADKLNFKRLRSLFDNNG